MLPDYDAQNLNEKIAYVLGWQYRPDGPQGECWVGRDGLVEANPHLPDFCRNVREIGYLMEWLTAQECIAMMIDNNNVNRRADFLVWRADLVSYGSNDLPFFGYGETAGEALCRAILAYTEGKK